MATVYEAIDLRLDRTVAVKVMHEGLTDETTLVAGSSAKHVRLLGRPTRTWWPSSTPATTTARSSW